MSRTHHHRHQNNQHCGEDYGSRYRCNKGYGLGYGKYSRKRSARERRADSKILIKEVDDETN